MLLAHKIELYVTKRQEQYLMQCVYANRYAYNQLIELFYSSDKIPTKKEFNEHIKQLRASNKWLQELSTRVVRNTVDDITSSIKRAFTAENKAKRNKLIAQSKTKKDKAKAIKFAMPKFKKRGVSTDSFAFREKEKFKVVNRKFTFEKFPKYLKALKLRDSIRFNGILKQVTISRKAGKWFASFLIETDDITLREPSNDVVGVDLGVKELATLSDGKTFINIKSYNSKLNKLQKLQESLSRKQYRSNNYFKLKDKVSKLHYYISLKRKEILHQLTSYLVTNYKHIAIEDLSVSDMLSNSKLARQISDVGFYEFRRQLEYKVKMYGNKLTIVDRYYPSSKTCSNCGSIKKDLTLNDRTYRCNKCGVEIDRDLNASMNLKQVATRSGETINACVTARNLDKDFY